MLQVTEAAASVFQKFLDHSDAAGDAIRLVPDRLEDGQTGIGVQVIEQPQPEDEPTDGPGPTVVLSPELAPALDQAVLDARETDTGADLFVRAQTTD